MPLPKGLTTHKLRHTFASILVAIGEDPLQVMGQLGHFDPGFTLRVYSHLMSHDTDARAKLKALVNGELATTTETPVGSSRALTSVDYEKPILKALESHGGRARRRDILATIREQLNSRFSDLDLERLPSGVRRWEALAAKAGQSPANKGTLERTTRGVWHLGTKDPPEAGYRTNG